VAERTAQLVEANTNLQTFAYTAAHDLRAPLRAMRSFSSILLEECSPQLEGECATYLHRVVNAAGQMEHLLNDLLEYSKVSQADIMLAAVDLNTATADALKLEEAEIRLQEATVQVLPSMTQALGHPATVLLIPTNFISNALKFIRPPVKPMIRIYAEARGHYVRVTVEDNGIGVRPEDQAKLFGVFQRLHGKQQFPGTGLGLAIARKGAERMGGRVGVESAPREGSRFWLELPAAETTA
jgi:signal transduction histidine kinase